MTPVEQQVEQESDQSESTALGGRRMAGAALMVMLFFVASRLTGLLREIVIGAQFGTSAELDAYLAAFRVPDILFQLVAGGALGSAFIPTFTEIRARRGNEAGWLLFSRILNLVTLLLVVLAALSALLAEPLMRLLIAPGFPPEQQTLAADLMRWMLLSTVIFGASGLVMGALNSVQHFLLPAAAPVLYNGSILIAAWLLAPRFGVHGLVIGVVVGALLHLLVQLPALLRRKVRYRFSVTFQDDGVREVARLMGPRVLGLLFVQINFLVNTILASGLESGSLSALNYAWLLMLLPQGIFAQAVATVAFPTFAALVAEGRREKLGQTLEQILGMVFFVTLPAALFLFVLRIPLIEILLERGSFDEQSTAAVAYALQFYALGLVAHALVEISVRAFYALHDTFTPVLVGIGAMGLNILLSLMWVHSLSYGGLALANSVATGLEMLLLLYLLRGRLGSISWRRLASQSGRALLAAIGAAGVLALWLGWSGDPAQIGSETLRSWTMGVGGALLGGGVYLGLAALFGSGDLAHLTTLFRRRIGR